MSDQQWEIRYSNSRSRPYFYSNATKESVWDKPADLTDDDILTLKGAEHFAQPAPPPGKVRASHLLVKHKDSRRPGSWKTPKITITKEEAIEQLKAHQKALLDAPDLRKAFAELATKESDCSSARDGGDLGWFGPKQMQKPFEDASELSSRYRSPHMAAAAAHTFSSRAAYSTEVGKMSDIISTDSGVHLILRTE